MKLSAKMHCIVWSGYDFLCIEATPVKFYMRHALRPACVISVSGDSHTFFRCHTSTRGKIVSWSADGCSTSFSRGGSVPSFLKSIIHKQATLKVPPFSFPLTCKWVLHSGACGWVVLQLDGILSGYLKSRLTPLASTQVWYSTTILSLGYSC